MKNSKTNKMNVAMTSEGPRATTLEKTDAPLSQSGEVVPLVRIHLSVRATGISTLVVGERRFNRTDANLYATLAELVRTVEPLAVLPDPGAPGLQALKNRVDELQELLDRAVSSHETTVAELKQRLAEAEAAATTTTGAEKSPG